MAVCIANCKYTKFPRHATKKSAAPHTHAHASTQRCAAAATPWRRHQVRPKAVCSSIILRLFFDCSPILNRRTIEEQSENNRRTDGVDTVPARAAGSLGTGPGEAAGMDISPCNTAHCTGWTVFVRQISGRVDFFSYLCSRVMTEYNPYMALRKLFLNIKKRDVYDCR